MEKIFAQRENILPDRMLLQPKRMAAKISLGYGAAGLLWILMSDRAVSLITKNIETMVVLNNIKGSLFIVVTGVILYLLVYSQLQQGWKAQLQYAESVQELEYAHEQLTASDEELRQQFDELTTKTILIEEKDRDLWALFENMHDAFAVHEIITDELGSPVDYRYLSVNPAYEKLVGFSSRELIGHCGTKIYSEMDPELIQMFGDAALSGKKYKVNIFSRILCKHLSLSIYSPRKGQFAMLAMDITEEKLHERTVELIAYYDRLTGLPNRVKLVDILSRNLDKGTEPAISGALLYIDMDDLKLVNDSYGHSFGDAIIITAATHLVSLAEPGSVVARVGGDEFVVLIPGMTDSGPVERLATEIVATLSREYEVKELRFHSSISMGIVMYPRDGESVEELLMNADAALYEAKRSGKRCWRFFQKSFQETAYSNMLLINGLRNAIVNHELEVYYQPQISLRDGSVIAFEALLRWHSPQHGNVSPAQFIPLAEKTHLIESIGAWVIQEACHFSRQLAEAGYPGIRVAVNVSPRQLIAADFIRIIQEACREVDMEAVGLEIEITENIFIESMEDSVQKLNEIRSLGIHLSLDDFGTGYSSLTYLRSLPVQSVKIDRSFIDLIATDMVRADLISSIIDMAHVLGLSVVAEGVETDEQLDRLRQFRCDSIQGYLVSKAVPGADALKKLQNSSWTGMVMKAASELNR